MGRCKKQGTGWYVDTLQGLVIQKLPKRFNSATKDFLRFGLPAVTGDGVPFCSLKAEFWWALGLFKGEGHGIDLAQ